MWKNLLSDQNKLKINYNFFSNRSINEKMKWNNKYNYPKSQRSIEMVLENICLVMKSFQASQQY